LSAIFAHISGSSPKRSRILRIFSPIFPDFHEFSRILPGFSTNQTFRSGACTPCSPTS